MRLVVSNLLDRGWDAYWVLEQPLYVLTHMLDVIAQRNANNQPGGSSSDGSRSGRYVSKRQKVKKDKGK